MTKPEAEKIASMFHGKVVGALVDQDEVGNYRVTIVKINTPAQGDYKIKLEDIGWEVAQGDKPIIFSQLD